LQVIATSSAGAELTAIALIIVVVMTSPGAQLLS
jgi:hypothetical protein